MLILHRCRHGRLTTLGRFGGIYLDADTLFLRDWEELWGWKGAFAYRWSRLEKYNTAVLHLNKGSALGTFLFRTALKNDLGRLSDEVVENIVTLTPILDFHPMTVSRYLKEAHLEGLLLRLPDALFDSAWLGTEYYQRDRPPQPFFTECVKGRYTLILFNPPPKASETFSTRLWRAVQRLTLSVSMGSSRAPFLTIFIITGLFFPFVLFGRC